MLNKKELIQTKKNNARLYPIYKMCSWDLLFYYAIAFIFLVQTKGFSPAQVMFTDAMYPLFKIIFNIPCTMIVDKLGKRKSLILANLVLSIYLVLLMLTTNIYSVIIAYAFMAFAFTIKQISETNILCDSVTQRNGKGMFARIEEIGARNYYFLDGISSLATGFLFIVNGYLPIIVSLIFTLIAFVLSIQFKEVLENNKEVKNQTLKVKLKNYFGELKVASSFIFKSKRLQSLMLFVIFFDGLLYASYTLRETMLVELNVSAQYFGIIIAVLTFLSGMSASLQEKIHNKFRNKALSFIVVVYIPTLLLIGIITMLNFKPIIKMILILILYAIQYIIQSPYDTLKKIYTKSFASPEMRIKISSAFSLIKSISEITIALVASYLLTITTTVNTFIVIGSAFAAIMITILIVIQSKFGLRPEEYKKEDIESDI